MMSLRFSMFGAFLAILPLASAFAQISTPIPLWPEGKMPGTATTAPEGVGDSKGNVLRLTNVSKPALTVYPAPGAVNPAPAIVVCPGGSYRILSYDKEGTEIAAWLNTLGITGIVLKYRVPDNRDGALSDLERALRLVRQNAGAWNIDPARVGVMGFSAGGHLCARLCASSGKANYPAIDDADRQSIRPDFALLVYPAYLADKGGAIAPELPVTSVIPPTFIAQTEDDKGFIKGTRLYYSALRKAGIPVESYFVAKGGHGYGLRAQGPISEWPKKAEAWLRQTGVR